MIVMILYHIVVNIIIYTCGRVRDTMTSSIIILLFLIFSKNEIVFTKRVLWRRFILRREKKHSAGGWARWMISPHARWPRRGVCSACTCKECIRDVCRIYTYAVLRVSSSYLSWRAYIYIFYWKMFGWYYCVFGKNVIFVYIL